MKKLGFGLMRLPLLNEADPASVDVEQVKKMVDIFIEKGFTYFDTAWMYCGFNSENVAKEALVDRYPREAYTLATKLHAGFFQSLEDRDRIFNEQRKKTGVEFFDYYLLHGLSRSDYEKFEEFDCFRWLQQKKEEGLVKKIGFSFHDTAKLLDQILERHPEMELVGKAAEIIQSVTAVPCTGCSYCTEGCPKKIAIPQYFSLYNEDMREAEGKGWTANHAFYGMLAKEHGRAGDCIGCGQCEEMCPQKLPVIKHLQEVSKYYE